MKVSANKQPWTLLIGILQLTALIGRAEGESNVPQLQYPPPPMPVDAPDENSISNLPDGYVAHAPLNWDLGDLYSPDRTLNGPNLSLPEPADLVEEKKVERYHVFSFDFNNVATPYIISLWIIIVGLAKIGFHVTPKLSSICPESVVLMILGVLIGILLFYGGVDKMASSVPDHGPSFQQPLTPKIFFFYMLPPIVMDAGYHMPNRLFFDNLGSILLYAVMGTIWNALTIGFSLYICAQSGLFGVELPLLDTLLFSAIVSAVDPVAVLAVFEEIHVNDVLYIIVFGESLLNDAVTVVLYHMFEAYTEMGTENIENMDFVNGILSFFVISLGGVFMGIVWGFATAFVSRFTHHVKIIEPIFVFVMAYLSYLSAEMFHWSGILALTFCGITMKNYVEENITQTSQTTLKYAMKMLANSSESVIFLFLGVCTVTDTHDWNTWFVILTIVFALAFRTLGVVIFTAIANRFRLHKLKGIEQFIMAYGGLRGAVAFALVLLVKEETIPTKKMMVTTIIAIVYFTVFLQGMTVGPLVKILKVPRANKFEVTMNERLHTRLMDHVMAGIEDISGMTIGNYKIRDKFRHINNGYFKHWFLRDSHERGNSSRKIFETHSRLNLQDAINIVNKTNLNCNNNPPLKSISSIFRSFTTESNLQNNEVKQPLPDHVTYKQQVSFTSIPVDNQPATQFNYDMANLNYSPCFRDQADAEIHHILTDNFLKPVKRFQNYNRTDVQEGEDSSSTIAHQAQFQVRHLMNQHIRKRKNHKRSKTSLENEDSDEICSNTRAASRQTQSDNQDRPSSKISTDEGIVFTAKVPSKSASDSNLESPRTAIETNLPWRRNSDTDEGDSRGNQDQDGAAGGEEPLRQTEFAPWITSKEYLQTRYVSPTNTLIRNLDREKDKENAARLRPVFEIFGEGASSSDQPSANGSQGRQIELTESTNKDDLNLPPKMNSDATAINLAFEDDEHPSVSKL
ncbi:Sodium/hydrogen exchanger 3 [Halotydeus destructor]|nr:Sodium/hydrogen exchanger 3 [Halotydeus destructor]